jgi:hypothetical protein
MPQGRMNLPHTGPQMGYPQNSMGYHPQYYGGIPPGYHNHPHPPMQTGMGGQRGNMGMPGMARTGFSGQKNGGFLSKLFRRSGTQTASPASFFRAPSQHAAAALAQGAKSPASLTSILTNTQKVLQAAEQIGPMVQQYGPVIKNLPAIWKIYRGMKGSGKTEDSVPEKNAETKEKNSKPQKVFLASESSASDPEKTEQKVQPALKTNSASAKASGSKGQTKKSQPRKPKLFF